MPFVKSNEKVAEELSDFLLVKIDSTDQSNSLINGLKKARKLNANRLVIMLADMPFITPKIVKSVVERCDEHTPAAASTHALAGTARSPLLHHSTHLPEARQPLSKRLH